MRIRRSLCRSLAATLCLLPLFSLGKASEQAATFRDPANRFSISVPPGWKVRALGDSVQVVRGDDYLSVLVFERTPDANALIDDLGQKMGKKWKRFEQTGHGASTLAGHDATTYSFAGENAQGVPAVLRLFAVSSSGTAYVLVTGALSADLPKVQATLTQVADSFALLTPDTSETTASSPSLGLEVTDLTTDDATAYGLSEPNGALVIRLEEHGSAEQAGVNLHDVILSADGHDIDSAAMLQQIERTEKPGAVINLGLLRLADDGKPQRISVQIAVQAITKTR